MKGYLNAGMFFVASSILILAVICIFNLLTRYKIWQEIQNGNIAVALSTGGITLGVANIMRFAITANDSLAKTLIWGGLGAAALLVVYFAFEILTPKLNVTDEIAKGNKAVGLISFIFSLAFSYIIGSSIY